MSQIWFVADFRVKGAAEAAYDATYSLGYIKVYAGLHHERSGETHGGLLHQVHLELVVTAHSPLQIVFLGIGQRHSSAHLTFESRADAEERRPQLALHSTRSLDFETYTAGARNKVSRFGAHKAPVEPSAHAHKGARIVESIFVYRALVIIASNGSLQLVEHTVHIIGKSHFVKHIRHGAAGQNVIRHRTANDVVATYLLHSDIERQEIVCRQFDVKIGKSLLELLAEVFLGGHFGHSFFAYRRVIFQAVSHIHCILRQVLEAAQVNTVTALEGYGHHTFALIIDQTSGYALVGGKHILALRIASILVVMTSYSIVSQVFVFDKSEADNIVSRRHDAGQIFGDQWESNLVGGAVILARKSLECYGRQRSGITLPVVLLGIFTAFRDGVIIIIHNSDCHRIQPLRSVSAFIRYARRRSVVDCVLPSGVFGVDTIDTGRAVTHGDDIERTFADATAHRKCQHQVITLIFGRIASDICGLALYFGCAVEYLRHISVGKKRIL